MPADGLSIDGSCAHNEVPVPSAIALVNTAVRIVLDNLVFIKSPRIPVTRLNTENGEEFRSFDRLTLVDFGQAVVDFAQ